MRPWRAVTSYGYEEERVHATSVSRLSGVVKLRDDRYHHVKRYSR